MLQIIVHSRVAGSVTLDVGFHRGVLCWHTYVRFGSCANIPNLQRNNQMYNRLLCSVCPPPVMLRIVWGVWVDTAFVSQHDPIGFVFLRIHCSA